MRLVKSEHKLCHLCMEHHEVQTVVLREIEIYKGQDVSFDATYEYCPIADAYLENEDMIRANTLAMREAYSEEGTEETERAVQHAKVHGDHAMP